MEKAKVHLTSLYRMVARVFPTAEERHALLEALKNLCSEDGRMDLCSVRWNADDLNDAMTWVETPQGSDFWNHWHAHYRKCAARMAADEEEDEEPVEEDDENF